MKKVLALVLAACLMIGALAGCGEKVDDGKITITIGGWPAEDSTSYPVYKDMEERFEAQYPNINVEGDTWGFSLDTFMAKASGGQLPSLYVTSVTEVKRILDSGYTTDITAQMEEYGYVDAIRDEVLDLARGTDGKLYGVPISSYTMGLYINLNLFKQAGLMNDDGTPMIPKTWEELAELAVVVKEKTGKAGFVMPTTGNCGGWHFINLAWAYGTNPEFMVKENGKWKADFATEECAEALQFVKDLRWKYDAMPANALVDLNKAMEWFATDQAAMVLAVPPQHMFTDSEYMTRDEMAAVSLPAGPEGKYAQLGGSIRMLKDGLTPEEIDACFKWLEFEGLSPKLSDDIKKTLEDKYEVDSNDGRVIGINTYSRWKPDTDAAPIQVFTEELNEKYKNIDTKLYADYENFNDITFNPEPPVECQKLYSLIDGCIQAVLSDESVDPLTQLKKAQNDFQINTLDRVTY